MAVFDIGARTVGGDAPTFIVAEISANHNQSLERAIRLIKSARQAGADAVKLQTYTPDTLTIDCDREWFRVPAGSLWAGKTLYELYGEAFTPWEWHARLFEVARDEGLECFSTPFDSTAVDFLEELAVPAYKVASFEIVDLALLRKIGGTARPVIVSTGMASLGEIELAVRTLRDAGAGPLALLKCTSAYPAPPESMHLRTIPHLARTFDVVAGLSDHTLGGAVAVAAVALGAKLIEKHFTDERAAGGPDAAFSLQAEEFARMVGEVRQVDRALGRISYERSSEEVGSVCFRRSLFIVRDVRKGDVFTADNVRSIRPGYGLPPRHLMDVLGRTATRDIERGTPVTWGLVGD